MQLACIDKKREAAKHYNIKTMCIQASPTAPDSDEIAADQKSKEASNTDKLNKVQARKRHSTTPDDWVKKRPNRMQVRTIIK